MTESEILKWLDNNISVMHVETWMPDTNFDFCNGMLAAFTKTRDFIIEEGKKKMTESETLKIEPCLYCDNDDNDDMFLSVANMSHFINCLKCQATSPYADSKEEAVKLHNEAYQKIHQSKQQLNSKPYFELVDLAQEKPPTSKHYLTVTGDGVFAGEYFFESFEYGFRFIDNDSLFNALTKVAHGKTKLYWLRFVPEKVEAEFEEVEE